MPLEVCTLMDVMSIVVLLCADVALGVITGFICEVEGTSKNFLMVFVKCQRLTLQEDTSEEAFVVSVRSKKSFDNPHSSSQTVVWMAGFRHETQEARSHTLALTPTTLITMTQA